MTKKVYIDPGHGGSDPGAVGNGLKEKDLTLKISKYTRDYLRDNYEGVSVRMSRTTDKTLSLRERTNDANKWKADVLVSVHINAAGSSSATGYEDFIYNGAVQKATLSFRDAIHEEMKKVFKGFHNRGKKRANFHMLRESRMPAVLPEFLFITNKNDAAFLKKDSNLKLIGKHLAIGIAKHLKLKKKSTSSSSKKSSGGGGKKLYRVQIGAFKRKENADNLAFRAKARGFKDAFVKLEGNYYKVQIGAFSIRENADKTLKEAKEKGFKDAFIV